MGLLRMGGSVRDFPKLFILASHGIHIERLICDCSPAELCLEESGFTVGWFDGRK